MNNNNVLKLDRFKGHIEESIERKIDGVELDQQSFENYITDVLDMEIIKVENLGDKNSYRTEFEFTAKSKKKGFDLKYKFIGKFYDIKDFTPREDCLILKEISGVEGVHKVDETFYFMKSRDEANKKNRLINTSLSDLMSGVSEDHEMGLLVKILKETFEGKFGYEYSERRKGNESTFSINFNNKEVSISVCFSNTIQVVFEKKMFSITQITFREVSEAKLREDIEKLLNFLESYFNWNIVLDGKHSVTELYDFLASKKCLGYVNTEMIMNDEIESKFMLFTSSTLGSYDSYKQVELTIGYNTDTSEFILQMNYLFKNVELLCSSVDEVKSAIEQVESWVGPAD